jgi:hypothetical protein
MTNSVPFRIAITVSGTMFFTLVVLAGRLILQTFYFAPAGALIILLALFSVTASLGLGIYQKKWWLILIGSLLTGFVFYEVLADYTYWKHILPIFGYNSIWG